VFSVCGASQALRPMNSDDSEESVTENYTSASSGWISTLTLSVKYIIVAKCHSPIKWLAVQRLELRKGLLGCPKLSA